MKTYPTSTPISLAMKPSTEKIAKPETTDAPELKPDRIRHHLNELKPNLLYDPVQRVFATLVTFDGIDQLLTKRAGHHSHSPMLLGIDSRYQ